MPQSKPTIFISYSHKDEKEKDQLLAHLGVLHHEGLIDLWSDDRIGGGDDWEREINQAMAQARVAILLVTANFLTSDFILKSEVPTLLNRREHEGITIIPVIGKSCAWRSVDWLVKMNVRPKGGQPVWRQNGVCVDEELTKIAEEVTAIIRKQQMGEALNLQPIWEQQLSGEIRHIFTTSEYVCLTVDDNLHFLSTNTGEPLTSPQAFIDEFSLREYSVIGGAVSASGALVVTLLPRTFDRKAQLLALNVVEKNFKKSEPLSVKWHYQAPSTQLSAPIIADQTIYLIQKGPEVVALDIEDGYIHGVKRFDVDGNVHRDCVSLVFAANTLCLALCNGMIIDLSSQDKPRLYKCPKGCKLSNLATDGINLYFGVSDKGRKNVSICALNIRSRELIWETDLQLYPSGRHWRMIGRPILAGDTLYVTGRNSYIYAFDTETGHELWYQQMSSPIKLGALWGGDGLLVVDRNGTIQALKTDKSSLILTCHYDPKTPPVLNEWNPLIFTLINTDDKRISNTVLRLVGDFEGRPSENLTQQLYAIQPGKHKRCHINFKPTASGATVHVGVIVSYYQSGTLVEQKLDVYIPVLRSGSELTEPRMTISQDERYQYNHPALHALMMAALTNSDLARFCFEYFPPVYDHWHDGMNKRKKINQLIKYVHQNQQVEKLLIEIQQRFSKRYQQYITDIKQAI